MRDKNKKIFAILLLIVLLFIYVYTYLDWRKGFLLTVSEYSGGNKKQYEGPALFYFSTDDRKTFLGKIYFPAIIIELSVSGLALVKE